MKPRKKNNPQMVGTLDEYIRANRKSSREQEMETMGPGFHSKNRIHRSKKTYSRKEKHPKGNEE